MTRFLLRLFPAAWRERYGEELLDLVSETGMTPRVAADVARAGLDERLRTARDALTGGTTMVLGPAWRHPTAWAVVGLVVLLPTLLLIALSLASPYQLDRSGLAGVVNSVQSFLDTNRLGDLLLVSLPALAAFFAGVPLVRIGYTRVDGGSEASLSVRLRAMNVVVVVIGLGISSLLVGHIVFESVLQLGP